MASRQELKEMMDRRSRKRERDREYWGRHAERLNGKRKQKYAREREALIAAEEAAIKGEE